MAGGDARDHGGIGRHLGHSHQDLAFVVSVVTCALAGALVAQQNQYCKSDFITFNQLILLLVIVIVGGSGSLDRSVFGAVILTFLDARLAPWPAR